MPFSIDIEYSNTTQQQNANALAAALKSKRKGYSSEEHHISATEITGRKSGKHSDLVHAMTIHSSELDGSVIGRDFQEIFSHDKILKDAFEMRVARQLKSKGIDDKTPQDLAKDALEAFGANFMQLEKDYKESGRGFGAKQHSDRDQTIEKLNTAINALVENKA